MSRAKAPVRKKNTSPLEHYEQKEFIKWCRQHQREYRRLDLIYAVPNGDLRNKKVAIRLLREGTHKGVPDLCLPVARGPFHGLYIEMKRLRGGKVSIDQRLYIQDLILEGYEAKVAKGWEAAADIIRGYYALGPFAWINFDPLGG